MKTLNQINGHHFRVELGKGGGHSILMRVIEVQEDLTMLVAYPLSGGRGERLEYCGKSWFVDKYRRGLVQELGVVPPAVAADYIDRWEPGSAAPIYCDRCAAEYSPVVRGWSCRHCGEGIIL